MATTHGVPAALRAYLANASPQDVQAVVQVIQDLPQYDASAGDIDDMMSDIGEDVELSNVKRRSKTGKRIVSIGGPKRPLNSFIAFRKFYGASLPGLPQKSISKIMVGLWHSDPFEAKWAMLAKAYSTLRGDREKDEVPLSNFFDLCAPFIGVIPADQYMLVMGWRLEVVVIDEKTKSQQLIRTFVPDVDKFPQAYTTTVLSVDDIVQHATMMGLLGSGVEHTAVHVPQTERLSMAVQPTTNFQQVHHESEARVGDGYKALKSTHAAPLPKGASILVAAEALAENLTFPVGSYFDPAGDDFELAYDPNTAGFEVDDHGLFDAYDLGSIPLGQEPQMQLNINDYVHEDMSVDVGF